VAATGKESLSVVFIPDRTAVFVVPLHAGGTHDAAVHSLNGSPRIVEDATRQYTPIVVEFDPDFMLVSMEMWRKSHDMQIPISDEFKIHFMENRRPAAGGICDHGQALEIIVRDPNAVGEPAFCWRARATGCAAVSQLARRRSEGTE
jgi:hypothetical protein